MVSIHIRKRVWDKTMNVIKALPIVFIILSCQGQAEKDKAKDSAKEVYFHNHKPVVLKVMGKVEPNWVGDYSSALFFGGYLQSKGEIIAMKSW